MQETVKLDWKLDLDSAFYSSGMSLFLFWRDVEPGWRQLVKSGQLIYALNKKFMYGVGLFFIASFIF